MTDEIEAWVHRQFFDLEGYFTAARFAASLSLYRTELRGSFVQSMIDGSTEPANFRRTHGPSAYNALIQAIREASREEKAYWFYITDPDNAFSQVEWARQCNYSHSVYSGLESLETLPAAEGGGSRLCLAAASGKWLLLHEYNSENYFEISIHGSPEFCQEIAARLGIQRD